MLYNSVVRAWRFTPLLTTLALLSACTEESAGGATESAGEATDGIAVSSPSSSNRVPSARTRSASACTFSHVQTHLQRIRS